MPELQALVEARVGPFYLCLHLQSSKRYMQARILGLAPRKQWSHPIYLHLRQLAFLLGWSFVVAPLP